MVLNNLNVKYMTWKEAILKVLAEEGTPLHYSDIQEQLKHIPLCCRSIHRLLFHRL